jgi:hypothetical protein
MKRLVALVALTSTLAACGGGASSTTTTPSDTTAVGTIEGYVHAGPVCPVETDPPDPACADRPVEGAVLLITDREDVTVATVTSDAEGRFTLALPPGAYRLVPQAVEGLLGTAPSEDFTVASGATTTLDVAYDTGIR